MTPKESASLPLTQGQHRPQPALPFRRSSTEGRPKQARPRLTAPDGSHLAVLAAGDLFIDDAYQRPLNHPRVDDIVADFRPELFGVLEVSARCDGRYAVIDGHHRLAALSDLDAYGDQAPVICHIHTQLDLRAEAALFHDFNKDRRGLTGLERWRARISAGDHTAGRIDAILAQHQVRLTALPASCATRFIRASEEIFAYGSSELLQQVLHVADSAWGPNDYPQFADLLVGIGIALLVHPSPELEGLIQILGGPTPCEIATRAELRRVESGPASRRIAVMLIDLYNARTRPQAGDVPSAQRLGRWRRNAGPLSAKQTEMADRRQQIARLTREGHSAATIALWLGIDRRQVVRDRRFNRTATTTATTP